MRASQWSTSPPTRQDLRAAFREYRTITLHDTMPFFVVKFPYSQDLNRKVARLTNRPFNKRYTRWEVPVGQWLNLLKLAPEIEALWEQEWEKAFIPPSP